MKKETKTVMLYSVTCGLYVDQSLFSPFPNVNGNYTPDLDLAKERFQNISIADFNKKDVLLARMKGYKTYNKYILQVEVPVNSFNLAIRDELVNGFDGAINECVWEEKVNWKFYNVLDEVFDIEGGISSLHITNVREWTEEEICTK